VVITEIFVYRLFIYVRENEVNQFLYRLLWKVYGNKLKTTHGHVTSCFLSYKV
jgi:hypothetical protein